MKIVRLSDFQETRLKEIRGYFITHDKTTFEHGAYAFLNDLIKSAESPSENAQYFSQKAKEYQSKTITIEEKTK